MTLLHQDSDRQADQAIGPSIFEQSATTSPSPFLGDPTQPTLAAAVIGRFLNLVPPFADPRLTGN